MITDTRHGLLCRTCARIFTRFFLHRLSVAILSISSRPRAPSHWSGSVIMLEFFRYLLSFRRPNALPVTVRHFDFVHSADILQFQCTLLYWRCSRTLSFHWSPRRGDNNEKPTRHA